MLTSILKKKKQQQQTSNQPVLPFPVPKNRKVLKVSSINFNFKSADDQYGIIENFAKFLNSLNYPVQIICDTQLINPEEWSLKIHDQDYFEFLKELVETKNVAEKIFYIAFVNENVEELRIITNNIKGGIKRCGLICEEVEYEELQQIPELRPGYVKIGEYYHSTFIVKDWPYACNAGWLEDLYNLDKNLSLSMFIEPQDNEYAMKYISKKLAQSQSNAVIKEQESRTDNVEDEEIISALNMRNELLKREGKFFFVSYYVTVKSKTLESLKSDTKFIKSFLNGMMIETRQATLRQDDGYKCSIPQATNYLRSKAAYTMTTTPLKQFFPFISGSIVDRGGVLIGENLLNNSLVFLDHFRYPTASMVVIGKAGSGKSYTVKAQIDKMTKQGIEVTVMDIEDEFGRMEPHPNLIIKHFGKGLNDKYKEFLFEYWDKVNANPNKPRFLVVDEFWYYMKDPEIAQLLQMIGKLGRKRWLGICPVTQETDDILKDEYARSLINNSSIKILLQIEPNQRKAVKEVFNLTEPELSFLVGATEGEGIIFAGSNHVQFKTVVSNKQHKQITTKPQEIYKGE